MGLRAVHWSEAKREWTFIFESGARLPTTDPEMAAYMADEHKLPRNKYGFNLCHPDHCNMWDPS